MIYVLRHCEALHNIKRVHDYDTDLTLVGVNHAKTLGGYYDYIICSPLKRCRQTLEYSNIRGEKM